MSSPPSSSEQLLDLIADPFASTLSSNSIYAALFYSFGVSFLFFVAFSLLRPRKPSVYAPRSKHADSKHAPPPLKKGLFGWRSAIRHVKEEELMERIGLDGVIFLRFLRMCRNIFLLLTLFGCGILIPVNLAPGSNIYTQYGNVATLMKFTPQYIFGPRFWAYVACAWIFDVAVCGILYHNYRVITRLRQRYFQSEEYQTSLHSRTLMITHVPKQLRNDQGLLEILSEAKAADENPSVSIGRDITGLADLIEQHDDAVVELEKRLANYLSNPNKLPTKRPMMKPFKNDKAHSRSERVDAINYLYSYTQKKKSQISQVREDISIGKQKAMPYGFASFNEVETAHVVARAAGKEKVLDASIHLAPSPNDILWKSLPMTRAQKRNRRFWFTFLITALTLLYVAPNVLAAVFLSNLSHLGLLWPTFKESLDRHPRRWAAVQGIAAPVLQNLFYFFLPTLFRRWYNHSGDNTKTQRERHVANKLFTFYVFNRLLVFSIFASLFRFISAVIASQRLPNDKRVDIWTAFKNENIFSSLMLGLCNVSPYWLTLQMQSNLSATIDLLQVVSLIWRPVIRRVMSPTPRQIIQFDAPTPLLFAEYYSSYLFLVMVGLCFATLQPLILPITALYLALEYWFKKYMLQYVYHTKLESGGLFWKNLFNRILFCTFFGNVIIALIVGANSNDYNMLYALIPLPILLLCFKWYCARAFNNKIQYCIGVNADTESHSSHSRRFLPSKSSKQSAAKASESSKTKLSVRFGHPALYRKLMTIMVNEKAKNLLNEVIQGHTNPDLDGANDAYTGVFGYTDVYMSRMAGAIQPGKLAAGAATNQPPSAAFELVAESDMQFSNFKKRADFLDEAGGGAGELYGRPEELIPPATHHDADAPDLSRPGSPSTTRSHSHSRSRSRGGVTYPAGYHAASSPRTASPAPPRINVTLPDDGEYYDHGDLGDEARGRLLRHGAPMGRDASLEGLIAATPGTTALATPASMDGDDETSYDYFRRGRGAAQ